MLHGSRRAYRRVLVVLLLGLGCCMPSAAMAARVYGIVRYSNGNAVVRGTLDVFDASGAAVRSFSTDDAGGYSVFLKSGLYRVVFQGRWSASLQSFEEATEQSIWLTVEKR